MLVQEVLDIALIVSLSGFRLAGKDSFPVSSPNLSALLGPVHSRFWKAALSIGLVLRF